MKYVEFEGIISPDRMRRYVNACGGNTHKGMTLYRYNLALSGEMLKIISCFEVALRNRIHQVLSLNYGKDWLRDSCLPNGMFDNPHTMKSRKIIIKAYTELEMSGTYSPTKLLSEMDFGIWKYMFTGPQYIATGQKLLGVFPYKPKTTRTVRIDNKFIFNELNYITQIRNRIAHHEPICFLAHKQNKSDTYARQEYKRILKLFSWMGIDDRGLLYGIDHIDRCCRKIMGL